MIRSLVAACFTIVMSANAAQAETVRLAVTTSFENSGLAELLLPQIAEDIGIDVALLVVGTGQALRLGEAGDVDAVLVHARAAEEAFVAAGHATHRTEIMYNDFVLVGPETDPAETRTASGIVTALEGIASAEATFVSRGDDSGTHQAELAIWTLTGLDVASFGPWYNAVGSGMGATLNTAAGLDGYVLSDRASWLNFANKGTLDLLYAGDQLLFNQYSFLPVNPAHHPHIKADAVALLEAWLTSPAAEKIINGYRIQGEQVFTFNATAQ